MVSTWLELAAMLAQALLILVLQTESNQSLRGYIFLAMDEETLQIAEQ